MSEESRRKRTEDEPDKLVFGIDRVCPFCKGKGTTRKKMVCGACDGRRFIREGGSNGKG